MKILSINLCTSMPGHPRKERIAKVRQFIEAEGVDVCLFQEGLSICPPIYSTPKMLTPEGFSCVHKPNVGVWWFYTFRVGVISRWAIHGVRAANIEVPQTLWLDSLPLPGRSRAVAVTVETHGKGPVVLVSVHMAASPQSEPDREIQFSLLIKFLRQFSGPMILAGDFNCSIDHPCMAWLEGVGLRGLAASQPDFIFCRGFDNTSTPMLVLTKDITDHAGGILVENV